MAYIHLENVSLDYPLYDAFDRSFLKSLKNRIPVGGVINANAGSKPSVLALDNVNLRFENGDRVALLGHNGAGKSSLLKLLAGFYEPSEGVFLSEGRVSALLSLTAGMDMNQSGYKNILMCGMLRGLSKNEVLKRMPEIVDFCELGSYLHIPIRLYSDGMILRLAFAICSRMSYEILLMDEWFATGDLAFVEKAKSRLLSVVNDTSILVFATHNSDFARQLCNKAVYLEHGKVLYQGTINDGLEYQRERLSA